MNMVVGLRLLLLLQQLRVDPSVVLEEDPNADCLRSRHLENP